MQTETGETGAFPVAPGEVWKPTPEPSPDLRQASLGGILILFEPSFMKINMFVDAERSRAARYHRDVRAGRASVWFFTNQNHWKLIPLLSGSPLRLLLPL